MIMKPLKVIIACSNGILRKGMANILADDDQIRVVGEVGTWQEIFKRIDELLPDIILVEYYLAGLNGIDVVRRVSKKYPDIRMAMFSTSGLSIDCILEALEAGVIALLDRSSSHQELLFAIKAAGKGESYLSPTISTKVLKNMSNPSAHRRKANTGTYNMLTLREREILHLLAEGVTVPKIADMLCISQKTVRNHKCNLMDKLGLKNVVDLTKYAIQNDLVYINLKATDQ